MTVSSSDIGPFSIVPRWVAEACKGQHLALATYVWLSDHADRRDNGFTVGRTEVADALGVGESTSARAIAHLVSIGALEVVPQRNGVRQGWSRFHVRQAIPQSPASETLTDSQSPASGTVQSPASGTVTTLINPKEEPLLVAQQCDDTFERFWKSYPRRQGTSKKAARSSFKSALKRGHLEEIRDGLKRDKAMWAAERRAVEHIPHAATWLNQERYMPEDDGAMTEHPDAGMVLWTADDRQVRIEADGSYTPLDAVTG